MVSCLPWSAPQLDLAISLDPAKRWVRAPDALWRWTAGGAAVLPADAEEPILLNGPASALWILLEEPCGIDDICAELKALFEGIPESYAAEVSAMLDRLTGMHAVTVT